MCGNLINFVVSAAADDQVWSIDVNNPFCVPIIECDVLSLYKLLSRLGDHSYNDAKKLSTFTRPNRDQQTELETRIL